MSETRLEKPKEYHPVLRLILENPLISFNVAVFIFVGGTGYATMMGQINGMERKIEDVRREVARIESANQAGDASANLKFERINAELTELKVTLRGVSTSLDFLVSQERRRQQ